MKKKKKQKARAVKTAKKGAKKFNYRKIALSAAVIIVVILLAYFWYVGSSLKNSLTENDLRLLVPIAVVSSNIELFPENEADIADYCPTDEKKLTLGLANKCIEHFALDSGIMEKCKAAESAFSSFYSSILSDNEIVLGINRSFAELGKVCTTEDAIQSGFFADYTIENCGITTEFYGIQELRAKVDGCILAISNYSEGSS